LEIDSRDTDWILGADFGKIAAPLTKTSSNIWKGKVSPLLIYYSLAFLFGRAGGDLQQPSDDDSDTESWWEETVATTGGKKSFSEVNYHSVTPLVA
jgi:hypothetical protein